jgi:hypothetical protein
VRVRSSWPLSRSQTFRVRSPEPETARRPSGVTATARPPGVAGEGAELLPALQVPDLQGAIPGAGDRPAAVRGQGHRPDRAGVAGEGAELLPLSRSQTFRVLSSEPETARRPSGVRATARTRPVWPREGAELLAGLQVPDLQGLIPGAETARRPSGVRATARPQYVWPLRVRSSWPVSRSQTFRV